MPSPWYLLGIAGVSNTGKISALKKLTTYRRSFQILGVTSHLSPDIDNPHVQNAILRHLTITLEKQSVAHKENTEHLLSNSYHCFLAVGSSTEPKNEIKKKPIIHKSMYTWGSPRDEETAKERG